MKNPPDSSHRAKARWKLLAQALKRNNEQDVNNTRYSVRRFSGYGLYEIKKLNEDCKGEHCTWHQYTLKLTGTNPMKIRILLNTTSAQELIGFNNTGNVCVWPSEEVLAYMCMKNKFIFKGKKVCELGCGMTGLAGMQIATSTECNEILLTDGNQLSVDNMNKIIKENTQYYTEGKMVKSTVLKWGEELTNFEYMGKKFDFVLCADCLFFVDAHDALLTTIKTIMAEQGTCVILAPKRSDTLHKFVQSANVLFNVQCDERYDDFVWNLHETSTSDPLYSPDLHYPLLLKLCHKGKNKFDVF